MLHIRNVKKIDIILDHVKVPSVETTYWCKIQKLDDMFKYMHHIVQVSTGGGPFPRLSM